MVNASRRSFLETMAAGVTGAGLGLVNPDATAQVLGQRPHQAEGVRVLNPRTCVPLSFWMKRGEIARYWAAKELTAIEKQGKAVTFQAPFASPSFTIHIAVQGDAPPQLTLANTPKPLIEVAKCLELKPGASTRDREGVILCFDVPKGLSRVQI